MNYNNNKTDAKEAMEFYNVMLVDFQKSVVVSQSPREIAYQECISVLKQYKEYDGVQLEELITVTCQRNKQLANYFGYEDTNYKSFKIESNKKVRQIYEMLLNHSQIKKIQEKPIYLKWISDPTDLSDRSSNGKIEKQTTKDEQNESVSRSVELDRSDSDEEEEETITDIYIIEYIY